MKKYKIIFIKNPVLRKIRNNLRALIIHAYEDQVRFLRGLRDGFDSDFITPKEEVEQGLIYTEILELQEALRKSICQCGTCGSHDNDMIYIPSLDAWHCVKCDSRKVIWYPNRS